MKLRVRKKRKRAFAFGLCFHPWHFEIMRRLAIDRFLLIGPTSGVLTMRQAYALTPRFVFQTILMLEPGHDESAFTP